MSDGKVRPPTEAGLAAIRARAEKATPGPWRTSPQLGYVIPSDVGADYKVAQVGGSRDSPGQIARDDPFWQADTLFIAHARSDVPALLAAVEERDGLLHDMQQEGLSYQFGFDAGIASAVRRLEALARQAKEASERHADGHERRAWAERAGAHESARVIVGADSPFAVLPPPDQARAEAERLRAVLRRIVEDGECDLGDAVRWAREAIGEGAVRDRL